MSEIPAEIELDMTGLLCPLPVLKTRKALQALGPGTVVKVIATDPMSVIDMPHFCLEQGHALLGQEQDGQRYMFRIRRA
jgi:tRNA 2-thiouridine synthesizing protein A